MARTSPWLFLNRLFVSAEIQIWEKTTMLIGCFRFLHISQLILLLDAFAHGNERCIMKNIIPHLESPISKEGLMKKKNIEIVQSTAMTLYLVINAH